MCIWHPHAKQCHHIILYITHALIPTTTTGASSSGRGGYTGSSDASASAGAGAGAEIEHSFGRPLVLAKLGQYIMDIKVRVA